MEIKAISRLRMFDKWYFGFLHQI